MADRIDFATAVGTLVKSARWSRPSDATTTDVNAYVTEGFYPVTRAGVLNRPVGAAGDLEVLPRVGANVIQRWTTTEAAPVTYVRRSSDGGSTWSPWTIARWVLTSRGAGTDFNTLTIAGIVPITSASHTNSPVQKVGHVEVVTIADIVWQEFTDIDRGVHRRVRRGGAWTAWNTSPSVESVAALTARLDAIERAARSSVPRQDLGLWEPTATAVNPASYVATLSRDRLRGWNANSLSVLQETRDLGATWTPLRTFSSSVGWVREMSDGELLVCIGRNPAPRELWRSIGYPANGAAATWEKVLTAAAPSVTFSTAWGFYQHENIVLVAEYGPKWTASGTVVKGENARYANLSLDAGKTWRRIFDLNAWVGTRHGRVDQESIHLHGIAWDPYWDRIWISYGDDVNGVCFSDDLGVTWQAAHWSNVRYSSDQVVGILPTPQRILFGTDTAPNGVMAFDRSEGKKKGLYTLKQAYTIPGDDGATRTHLCQKIHRVPLAGGDEVYIFGFSSETNPAASFMVATRDGWDWKLIWQDSVVQAAGKGLRSIIGPTLTGELIVGSDDQRTPNMWTTWRGPAPIY